MSIEEDAVLDKGFRGSDEWTGTSSAAFEVTVVSLYILELEELGVFNSRD